MRTIFMLTGLLIVGFTSFAGGEVIVANQTNWRWRNNNGSETTATWKATQNTAVTFNGKGVIRLRIEIVNLSYIHCPDFDSCPIGVTSDITLADTLQYSTNPSDASSWKNIGFDTTKAFIIRGAGNRLTQGQVTTHQLIDSSYPFSPGKVMVSDTVLGKITIPTQHRSELEWSLRATTHLLPNTTYYFRHNRSKPGYGVPYSYYPYYSYPQGYPSLKTPAKVSASAFEEDMMIPALNDATNKATLSVVPNPAHSGIGFRLNVSVAAMQVLLTDASGRMLYRQSFANVQAGVLYKLNPMQQPATGLYILKVTGNGLSESSKVIVQ